jgi:hypothetical protein
MTTIALKKKIYSRLKDAKNKFILEHIYKLLQLEEVEDELFELSNDQLKKVKKRGRFGTNTSAR